MKIFTFFCYVLLLTYLISCGVKPSNTYSPYEPIKTYQTHTIKAYQDYCAGCHGQKLNAFVDKKWNAVHDLTDVKNSIRNGILDQGMPAFGSTFSEGQIDSLSQYVFTASDRAKSYQFTDKKYEENSVISTEKMDIQLQKVIDNIKVVWSFDFLPDNQIIYTQRSGEVFIAKNGEKVAVKNIPRVVAEGQGGMMEVRLHPTFSSNKLIYLSYSKGKKINGQLHSTTALLQAKLVGNTLQDTITIFEALPYSTTRHHYGGKIAFNSKNELFLTVGDRGSRDTNPQDLNSDCGKVHFIQDTQNSVYSLGHRNPQGIIIRKDGSIWEHEHGPRGGDEWNIIHKGNNYGWPIVSYGINYNGTTFTEKTEDPAFIASQHHWVPSIAPSGFAEVIGDKYPAWQGNLLVGSLRFRFLNRMEIKNEKVVHEESLFPKIGRLREVRISPDGYIYIAVENEGVFRLNPVH